MRCPGPGQRSKPLSLSLSLSSPYRKSDDESYASFVSPSSFELSKPRGGKKFWEENEFFSRLLNRKNRSLASHICIIPFRRKRSNSRVSLRVRGVRISISNRQMRAVDQPVGTCTGREPEQDGRFNRLMAFKRGTGRGRVASARGWTPRVCVRLLDYTGFPRRTQRRAPIFCVSACLCVCVSRQAITLMIIYDRGHTYVSPGRN